MIDIVGCVDKLPKVPHRRIAEMPLQIGFVDGFFPRVVPTTLRMSPRPALSVVPPLGLPARRATVATLSTTSKTLHGLSRRERFPRRKMPRGMASQRTPRCSLQFSPCLASPASSSRNARVFSIARALAAIRTYGTSLSAPWPLIVCCVCFVP